MRRVFGKHPIRGPDQDVRVLAKLRASFARVLVLLDSVEPIEGPLEAQSGPSAMVSAIAIRPILMLSRRADQATFPRAVFVTDHRRSISFTAIFMLGRYFRAATSGVIDDEKKIRLRLPRTGPPPGIANAMALMPVSDPPTDDA